MSRSQGIEERPWRTWKPAVMVALVAIWALSGCRGQDGPQRYRLSGKVTFDGKPVPFGDIVFEPDTREGNSGPQGAASIVNGAYDTGAEKGLVGGPHVVRINGYPSLPSQAQPNITPLFAGYEVREDLPKENGTKDFSVPALAGKAAKSGEEAKPTVRPELMP